MWYLKQERKTILVSTLILIIFSSVFEVRESSLTVHAQVGSVIFIHARIALSLNVCKIQLFNMLKYITFHTSIWRPSKTPVNEYGAITNLD